MDIRKSLPFRKILLEAGWFEGRSIDVQKNMHFLRSEGFAWGIKIEAFLKEFGNLSYVYFDRDSHKEMFHFYPLVAFEQIDKYWVLDSYSKRVNKELCMIGQSHRGHMVLSMAKDGSVYGGYDDFLCFIGSSGEEAIENLINQVELPEIA